MGRVAGKVAIVTGGASGMGRADARALVREGAKVMITDLNVEDGEAVAAELGDDACFMRHDVASEDDWKAVVAATVERFGKLNVLVNNAGILAVGTVTETDIDLWRKVNAVNSDGVFLGCKHALPAMTESGGGSIINMSSVAALHGLSVFAAYSASKGAVRSLTKSVAMYCKENNTGVRCNSIHPDGVRTAMVAKVTLGKEDVNEQDVADIDYNSVMADPEEIAHLVVYLASDESRFVSGSELVFDNCATITPPASL